VNAHPPLLLLDIGLLELLLLVGLAIMLFGGDLPDTLRRAGRFVARLRGMAAELARDVDPQRGDTSEADRAPPFAPPALPGPHDEPADAGPERAGSDGDPPPVRGA